MEATFAVSESGYMDDELGLSYMVGHFEPYTLIEAHRCLIADGHSPHITWKFVKYALDHNIHRICLPSKSTHLLQPLDVACFGVLQSVFERNLSTWLRQNLLLAFSKPAFLDILQATRDEVYTMYCLLGAWRKSRRWPIDRELILPPCNASDTSTNNIPVLDTPSRLRALSQLVEGVIRSELNPEEKEWVFELIDFAGEKVANGKVRRTAKKGRKYVGEARVLAYKYVNDGINKAAEDEANKLERQWISAEKKRIAEEKKALREALEKQWKVDLGVFFVFF